MRHYLLLIILLTLSLGGSGCSNEETTGGEPSIILLDPASAGSGRTLFIHGTGFGNNRDQAEVWFGEEPVTITAFSDTRITVIVPEGNLGDVATVKVKIGNVTANPARFVFKAPEPQIASISQGKGLYDETITITGINFSEVSSENEVWFNDVQATVLENTKTALKVKVPRIYQEVVPVHVIRAEMKSNELNFKYDLDRCDSLLIVSAEWTTTRIREGVVWKSASLTAFNSPQVINVVYITPSAANTAGIRHSTGLKKTSVQCDEAGATVGINGGYFGSTQIPFVRVDGVTIQEGLDNLPPTFSSAALTIQNNTTSILKLYDGNREARMLTQSSVMVCGPYLLKDQKVDRSIRNEAHNTDRHPRTAVGVSTQGALMMLTADGRSTKAAGVSTPELARIMWALGANDAMNLDGGGSTTMWISGHGIVNTPSDASERAVANIVYVK